MTGRILVGLVITCLTQGTAAAADAPLCPPSAVRSSLAPQLAAAPGKWQGIAHAANVSDATALSALPEQQAVGIPGTSFREIWDSLRAWPDAVTVIMKSDQVFEVHGKVPAGEPSKVSRYFNLDPKSEGVTGHLRPDLYAAIYATSLPGRDRTQHGILFFDPAGALIFGVYVPNEHAAEDSRVMEAFRATVAMIHTLPRVCAGA